MIYLVIFMFIVIVFLLGIIAILRKETARLEKALDDLETVLLTMDRAKEFEKNRES